MDHAAKLSGYTPKTLSKKLSEGCFSTSVKRGKPVLFWRDRFVLELMNGRTPGLSRSRRLPVGAVSSPQPEGMVHEAA